MAPLKKIVVTGSNGQVGSELRELATYFPAYEFIFLTRTDLSLTDAAAIEKMVTQHQPYVVINCAAYTAVDKAESEQNEAFQINGAAVGLLAKACSEARSKFFHISTDYVFDGSTKQPLTEEDPVQPVNVYGQSKLAGEQAALTNNTDSIIIRTSWVYSAYGKNFVKTMMRLMAEKESISVVSDQYGSPTYAADLANVIMYIVDSGKWQPGIYHFSNNGTISWAQFAEKIAALLPSPCQVVPVPTTAYPTPAKRPLYSVMDKTKIQQTFDLALINWEDSLRTCLQKLQGNPPLQ